MEGLVEWFEFQVPGKIVCAEHGVGQIGGEMEKIGGGKTLIVTDEGVEKAGLVDLVTEGLEGSAEVVGVFRDVPPNSEVKVVQKCYDMAVETGADSLVSVGGGSVIDTAKATALLMVETGDLLDHQSAVYMPSGPMPPHISVPTTAGTGSEATFAAVIADKEQELKLIFQGPDLAPDVAMLDPHMTVTLPPGLTAATGVDALTHCIEAMHSEMHQPACDGLALHGIRLVSRYLPAAVKDGEDIEARTYMLLAANMGGIAFANAFVGIVHAMAHSAGGHFGTPHGVANAIFLPHGMEFNHQYDEVPAYYARVAEALGLDVSGMSDMDVSRKAIEFLTGFIADLGLPQRLREVDVPEDGLEAIAEDAMLDGSMFNNPGEPEYEEVLEVIQKAY